jgi:hypothetical protein
MWFYHIEIDSFAFGTKFFDMNLEMDDHIDGNSMHHPGPDVTENLSIPCGSITYDISCSPYLPCGSISYDISCSPYHDELRCGLTINGFY